MRTAQRRMSSAVNATRHSHASARRRIKTTIPKKREILSIASGDRVIRRPRRSRLERDPFGVAEPKISYERPLHRTIKQLGQYLDHV